MPPSLMTYWIVSTCIVLACTIVGIAAIPFVVLGIVIIGPRAIAAMSCELTDRSLKIRKGILIKVEKTIPLEKITDLALTQGPIMRAYGMEAFSVETAGQSSAATGALVRLVGVKDTRGFRDMVMKQRDKLSRKSSREESEADQPHDRREHDQPVLHEIRDILTRIEQKLDQR